MYHKIVLGLFLVAASATSAEAWGNEGHQIVAMIAASQLTPAARNSVSDLLGGDPKITMPAVSTWADNIRPTHPETAPWHYVNIEIESAGYNAQQDCPESACVVAQIERDRRLVADNTQSSSVRAHALRFLIHFVGDVHQPLHAADNRDRGGNNVLVVSNGEVVKLHELWDREMVTQLGNDPGEVAERIFNAIPPATRRSWASGSAAAWANESFLVAKSEVYAHFGRAAREDVVSPQYLRDEAPIVARQLTRAGVRLAWILNQAFPVEAKLVGKIPEQRVATPPYPFIFQIVPARDASSLIGKIAGVQGLVSDVHVTRGGTAFIDMEGVYPNNAFTAVVFASNASAFPNLSSLLGHTIRVFGEVRLYRGKPEIILTNSDQLGGL